MLLHDRIAAFAALGRRLASLPDHELAQWQASARAENPWFVPDSVEQAVKGIVRLLDPESLHAWAGRYTFPEVAPRRVGVVMAGNIPAVGFHDMLCVLTAGHTLRAKLSSQDGVLLRRLAGLLVAAEPRFSERIHFVDRLADAEAVIATGSDNSARYFHRYFSGVPHVIRQNRTSCAVLTGAETAAELQALGLDITVYFGLGCRNVSKLYVPPGYDFVHLLDHLASYAGLTVHHKYANNYEYQRAVHLINQVPHYDNGFLVLTENEALASPMAVVYYSFYESEEQLRHLLAAQADNIQCVVSQAGGFPGSVPFGQAQRPSVDDYADGVDTMAFLLGLPAATTSEQPA